MDQTPIDLSGLVEPTPRSTIRVLLATTWDTPCGIAEHAFYLKQAVEAADPQIQILPDPRALDPGRLDILAGGGYDILHLNYHDGLHSRWTVEEVLRRGMSTPIITTYHDTGVPNSQRCKDICAASTAAVVHEPFEDLAGEIYYWRMGVPDPQPAFDFRGMDFLLWPGQPILGTVGFPFPWKLQDQLVAMSARLGWAYVGIAPGATTAQVAAWKSVNPHSYIRSDFVTRLEVQALLAGCDATAFLYVCCNTGQSGAILQGIATRKPVLALSTCRQFRSWYLDSKGRDAIRWVETFEEAEIELQHLLLQRVDLNMVAFAQRESWQQLGQRYAALYRRVACG